MQKANAENPIRSNPSQMNDAAASNAEQRHNGGNRQNGYRHQDGQKYAPNAYEVHSQGNPGQNGRSPQVYHPSMGGLSKRSHGMQSQGAQSRAVQSLNDG